MVVAAVSAIPAPQIFNPNTSGQLLQLHQNAFGAQAGLPSSNFQQIPFSAPNRESFVPGVTGNSFPPFQFLQQTNFPPTVLQSQPDFTPSLFQQNAINPTHFSQNIVAPVAPTSNFANLQFPQNNFQQPISRPINNFQQLVAYNPNNLASMRYPMPVSYLQNQNLYQLSNMMQTPMQNMHRRPQMPPRDIGVLTITANVANPSFIQRRIGPNGYPLYSEKSRDGDEQHNSDSSDEDSAQSPSYYKLSSRKQPRDNKLTITAAAELMSDLLSSVNLRDPSNISGRGAPVSVSMVYTAPREQNTGPESMQYPNNNQNSQSPFQRNTQMPINYPGAQMSQAFSQRPVGIGNTDSLPSGFGLSSF